MDSYSAKQLSSVLCWAHFNGKYEIIIAPLLIKPPQLPLNQDTWGRYQKL